MSRMPNFTKYIEAGRLNGTNMTGSIAEASKEMRDPNGTMTFIALFVIAVIFMLTIALIALTLIILVEPPRILSTPQSLQNNLRFVGDLEMHRMGNSQQEKSPVPKQGGWYGGSGIRF